MCGANERNPPRRRPLLPFRREDVPGRKYAPKGENVQKKYILLPKYLFIPNIYSTFAAGFDLKGEW